MFEWLINRFTRRPNLGVDLAHADALDRAVRKLAARGSWVGTATQLLDEIHLLPVREQIRVPGSASSLSATLRWRAEMIPGVRVEFLGRVGHRGARLISLAAK